MVYNRKMKCNGSVSCPSSHASGCITILPALTNQSPKKQPFINTACIFLNTIEIDVAFQLLLTKAGTPELLMQFTNAVVA